MKINLSYCILLVALAGASALAGPNKTIDCVIVTGNTIAIAHPGSLGAKEQVLFNGKSLSWKQQGSSTVTATLPAGLKPGSYSLELKGHDPFEVTIGAVGPQGLPGTNGLDGANGAVGPQGPVGSNGVDGKDGGLVSNFLHAYAVGQQYVLSGSPIVFTGEVVSSGAANSWSTNGTTITIPATGVYQISFMINLDYGQAAIDVVNATTPFVTTNIDVVNATTNIVNQGSFLFSSYYNYGNALSGQLVENCNAGDIISINNAGSDLYIGGYLPMNMPSATVTILQIK